MSTKNNKPSRIALSVETEFRASHSLEGFEIPHFHLWKVDVKFEASLPLANDRLVDMIWVQGVLDEILAPLKGTHLNQTLKLSPTSENLALWLWEKIGQKIPEAPLAEIGIRLCDLQGQATGQARVMK
jgi:6-pyruvoyl-tetrahydropterin synthase